MACSVRAEFSDDGRYFCYYSKDGKLRVWEGESGILKQEYTPNLHLSTTCTCLVWMRLCRVSLMPKKKRKLKSVEGGDDVDVIVLGTISGNILFYCIATGDLLGQVGSDSSVPVNSLSWTKGCNLFSCAGEYITEWSVGDRSMKSTWRAGSEVVKSILVLPKGKYLISASQSIKLWSLPSHDLLKSFVGHASNVITMVFVPSSSKSDIYFVSAAKTDNYINAWNLNTESQAKTPVAQFVVNEAVNSLNVREGSNGNPTTMCVITSSGIVHFFQLQLNGKCQKPIKPKMTLQVASNTNENESKESAVPVPIHGIHLYDCRTLLLCHGIFPFLTFEKMTPNFNEKIVCLVRKDPWKKHPETVKIGTSSKVIECAANEAVAYVNPLVAAKSLKREHRGKADVPMEERLENLTLNKPEQGVPRADNVAHLLLQGLQSKDKRMLHNVLLQHDENVIKRTVARLPVQVVMPLVQELSNLIHGNVVRCRVAAQWLRAVLIMHAGQLLANTSAVECLAPILDLVEVRLELVTPLTRLRGRLDLLLEQIHSASTSSTESNVESLLVHQDAYSSDEESLADEIPMNTDSGDNWDENSEEEEESEEQEADFDIDMSN